MFEETGGLGSRDGDHQAAVPSDGAQASEEPTGAPTEQPLPLDEAQRKELDGLMERELSDDELRLLAGYVRMRGEALMNVARDMVKTIGKQAIENLIEAAKRSETMPKGAEPQLHQPYAADTLLTEDMKRVLEETRRKKDEVEKGGKE